MNEFMSGHKVDTLIRNLTNLKTITVLILKDMVITVMNSWVCTNNTDEEEVKCQSSSRLDTCCCLLPTDGK